MKLTFTESTIPFSILFIVITVLTSGCAYMPPRYNTTTEWQQDAQPRAGAYSPESLHVADDAV